MIKHWHSNRQQLLCFLLVATATLKMSDGQSESESHSDWQIRAVCVISALRWKMVNRAQILEFLALNKLPSSERLHSLEWCSLPQKHMFCGETTLPRVVLARVYIWVSSHLVGPLSLITWFVFMTCTMRKAISEKTLCVRCGLEAEMCGYIC